MNNIFKKGISFALTLALVVTMCFGSIGTAKVHAAEEAIYPALSVYDGDTLVKEFSLDELKAIAAEEGDIKYKFSGYNRYPTFVTYTDQAGPTIEGILENAGIEVAENDLITFVATDQADASFTAENLLSDRYYFPNGKDGTGQGNKAPEEAYVNAEKVPAILSPVAGDDWVDFVLRFGQKAPTEQTRAVYLQSMMGGKLIVNNKQVENWEAVSAANYNSGEVLPETEIKPVIPNSLLLPGYKWSKKVCIYYTLDGSEPGYDDYIFNYSKELDCSKYLDSNYSGDYINPPVLDQVGETYTIKFKVIGYGKLDSDVTTFTYTVVDPDSPAKPAAFNATSASYNSVKLSWSKVDEADGYEIMRYNADTEKYETIASVLNKEMVSYTDKELVTGTSYNYQVRAFITLSSGQRVYGSATEAKAVTPTLNAPVIQSAARASYNSIQIKWKAVEGAEGYQVYRYSPATKKYSLAKTIAGNSVLAYTDAGLTTGTKYTYKVRAYKGSAVSAFSATKAATPYLTKPTLSSAARKSYSSIQIKWKKVAGATGYQVYRYDSKTKKWSYVKNVKSGDTVSFTNTGLKTGRKYTYKVRAYRGSAVSAFSSTKAATPYLTKPTISKVTAGKKSATVKWKKISGANGYKIYRSTKKNSGYKLVKTIKKGSTVSWKNTGLKKGKKYYYKVKAYRTVDKKKVYSSLSSSKYTKAK